MSLSHPTPETPTLVNITHRQRIARIVSGLRSVRPRVPFYRLAAHRVPTLWVLYRGLLRASPNSNVRRAYIPSSLSFPHPSQVRAHIQALFRRYRHLTSPVLTKVQLEKGHRVRIPVSSMSDVSLLTLAVDSGSTFLTKPSKEMNI
jgi:hypothetical protein